MNRNRLIMIGCAALVLAALVSFSIYRVLNTAIASANSADTPAVVAAFDLSIGSVITARDVRVMRFPGSSLPAGYFSRVEDVVGRGVLTPIVGNEVVLNSKVASENAGGGLPAMIPPGMRAVAVKVNDVIAVAGFALPGTRVDVVVTGNATHTGPSDEVSATTVLQNVQVLAAGQKLQKNTDGKPEEVQVITLLVTPEEAQKVALATQEGRIQLTLRNPLDADAPGVRVTKNAALYGSALPTTRPATPRAPLLAKTIPPPPTYTVEMIRGDKKDVTTFSGTNGEPK